MGLQAHAQYLSASAGLGTVVPRVPFVRGKDMFGRLFRAHVSVHGQKNVLCMPAAQFMTGNLVTVHGRCGQENEKLADT